MAVPLSELRHQHHHLSALWWLGLLYRRPQKVRESLEELSHPHALRAAACLLLYALPWASIFASLDWIQQLDLIDPRQHLAAAPLSVFGIAVVISSGIAAGAAIVIAAAISSGAAIVIAIVIAFWIPLGIVLEIISGIGLEITEGIPSRIPFGTAAGIVFGIPPGIVLGMTVGISLGVIFGISLGMTVGIAFLVSVLRVYYYPAHMFFVFPAVQGQWYRFHPVAWDDLCSLPFLGLHRLLVSYAAIDPAAGNREIERLITFYPSQRMEALKARAILVARSVGVERDLAALDARVAALPHGDKGFLKQVSDLRDRVGEIAQLQRHLDTMRRPAFRKREAEQLITIIVNFRDQLAGFREPLASEFRTAAEAWQSVAQEQLDQIHAVLAPEPLTQGFRAADAVNRTTEAFVPRMAVIEELVGQIMLATGCPGLLLYGRRRIGKSTLLCNLNGFLPKNVLVARFSMLNPDAFTSLASFAGFVARIAREALRAAPLASSAPETLPALFKTLSDINTRLAESDQRLMLACDEFEKIDMKIGEGVFTLDLLATIRESVQTHRHLTWVFTGTHELGELSYANWSSDFISLRMIEVLPFTPEETRLLLTEPLKSSPLWRGRPEQPRFDSPFWGESGIERIHAETGGWPHLVQLVAEAAVDIANERGEQRLNAEMLDTAFTKAVSRGNGLLQQLIESENRSAGERAYLLGFCDREMQPPPDDADVRRALHRRRLVLDGADGWRLWPLMRRWLIVRYSELRPPTL